MLFNNITVLKINKDMTHNIKCDLNCPNIILFPIDSEIINY